MAPAATQYRRAHQRWAQPTPIGRGALRRRRGGGPARLGMPCRRVCGRRLVDQRRSRHGHQRSAMGQAASRRRGLASRPAAIRVPHPRATGGMGGKMADACPHATSAPARRLCGELAAPCLKPLTRIATTATGSDTVTPHVLLFDELWLRRSVPAQLASSAPTQHRDHRGPLPFGVVLDAARLGHLLLQLAHAPAE